MDFTTPFLSVSSDSPNANLAYLSPVWTVDVSLVPDFSPPPRSNVIGKSHQRSDKNSLLCRKADYDDVSSPTHTDVSTLSATRDAQSPLLSKS